VELWLERTPGLAETGFNFPAKYKAAVEAIFKQEQEIIEVILFWRPKIANRSTTSKYRYTMYFELHCNVKMKPFFLGSDFQKQLCMYLGLGLNLISTQCRIGRLFFKKEVARGGERTRVLYVDFIYFLIFTTLPLSHSGFPESDDYYKKEQPKRGGLMIEIISTF
jgi:hypothetical protein